MSWSRELWEQWLRIYFAPRKLQKYLRQRSSVESDFDWQRPLESLPAVVVGGLPQVEPSLVEQVIKWINTNPNRGVLVLGMSDYPLRLAEIHDPPVMLFYEGLLDVLHQPQLAMVGSRNASLSSLQSAEWLATELSRSGVIITSGMAMGIDHACHRGCLQLGRPTIAVLGCGIDLCYPPRARSLKKEIIHSGLVVSEYLPGMPAKTEHFPARNRIISGLSCGVVVVSARKRSGSLITARFAAEQGREVFALPHSIREPEGEGCHALIQQGAKLVTCSQDILQECEQWLGLAPAPDDITEQSEIFTTGLAKPEILANVGFETTPFELFVKRSGLTVSAATNELISLELDGWIKAVAGGYVRVRR